MSRGPWNVVYRKTRSAPPLMLTCPVCRRYAPAADEFEARTAKCRCGNPQMLIVPKR